MKSSSLKVLAVMVLVALLSASALAKDAVKTAVSNPSPAALVVENGNAYSQGTYAIGTIQLFYTVEGFTWPASVGSFDLSFAIQAGSTRPFTSYPTSLTASQIGSDDLSLSLPGTFSVGSAAWTTGPHNIQIDVNPALVGQPADDGAELVANVKLSAPGGANLDTVTNIQVHVLLVHPTECLKLYNVITDQGMTTNLSELGIGVSVNRQGKVSSTPPQMSNNIIVVNTCSDQQEFELGAFINGNFELANGQPVKSYISSTDDFLTGITSGITLIGGKPHGASTCLGFTGTSALPGNSMLLITMHMSMKDSAAVLGSYTGFSATMWQAGSSCGLSPAAASFTNVGPSSSVSTSLFKNN
jgi:hypothetical protein